MVLQIYCSRKKSDRYDFPVHECTQEQRKWSFLSRKVVEIKTFCYHGNVSSHLSSLQAAMELVGSGRVAHLSHHLTLHTKGWVSKRGITPQWTADRDGPYFADFCYL